MTSLDRSNRAPRRAVPACMVVAAGWMVTVAAGVADEPEKSNSGSAVYEAARSFAAKTRVHVEYGDAARPATLHDQPVIRYSDQPIKAFDSTLWLWYFWIPRQEKLEWE